MKLLISQDVTALGIVHPVACIISKVRVTQNSAALDKEIQTLMAQLDNDPDEILQSPQVVAFRKLFSELGYPNQRPAGERLIDSFRRNGFKRYNNVVDAYNIVSALFGSGMGMHDASQIKRDITVYRSEGYEAIVPMFKTDSVPIPERDLIYAMLGPCPEGGTRVIAWLGKRDVDSEEFKVTELTSSLLLVVLGNSVTSQEHNRNICLKTVDLIQRTCPSATADFLDVGRSQEV